MARARREPLRGLPPAVAPDCRVLVLGSMPGAASLAAASYYAHPRNRFWPLMGALCAFDPRVDYPRRIAGLQRAGVGLWDVIGRCERRGSLDASIVPGSEVPNDVVALLESLPRLRAVAFNGGKAAQAFRRHLQGGLSPALAARIAFHALPSTSPANAGFGFERLLAAWGALGLGRGRDPA
ncbi:DNA-deoxyinosine glycosylase [Pseudoxanthomonas sangjuensis]|uniref:DNA-deoxyinosine glycosylase n=1 Tax=Pseudoxanthomonas sangjuensis TaxID=1503750 RepID=UPI0013920E52|nr:DNA-deoxyinosine glycosylase [Pseudoxanthomonas sangjuensis]KAF1705930.1 DNA-deoxyinosine glycosylase [Pseudoxanthomonas sangjuensis]